MHVLALAATTVKEETLNNAIEANGEQERSRKSLLAAIGHSLLQPAKEPGLGRLRCACGEADER